MEGLDAAIKVIFAGVSIFLGWILILEKVHKKDKSAKRDLARDIVGALIHTMFVIGDGLILVSVIKFFEHSTLGFCIQLAAYGAVLVMISVISFRAMNTWYEGGPETIKRTREF